jgi:hypothetical protein
MKYSRAASINPTPRFNQQNNPSNTHPMTTRRVRERNRNLNDFVTYSSYFDALHQEDYKLQDDMEDPIAFAAKNGTDVLH